MTRLPIKGKYQCQKKDLRIGLVGYGFMGRTHSNGYKRLSDFFPDLQYKPVLQAMYGSSEGKVKPFAEQRGYASAETGWKKLVAWDDIDVIDITTPNDMRKDVTIADFLASI